jgi:hypothetical protein
VLVYFDSDRVGNPHPCDKIEKVNHQVLSLCLAEQRSHFPWSHGRTALVFRVDAGKTDCRKVPLRNKNVVKCKDNTFISSPVALVASGIKKWRTGSVTRWDS